MLSGKIKKHPVALMQSQNMHTKPQYTFCKDTYKHKICIKHLECLPFLGQMRINKGNKGIDKQAEGLPWTSDKNIPSNEECEVCPEEARQHLAQAVLDMVNLGSL